jgi:hypothetical protein
MTAYETRISGLSPKIWVKFDSTGVITDSGSAATSWSLAGTAPTYSVTGISNNAYTFAGNGRYTSTTALPTNTFNDKIFTVEAWVKLTSQSTVDYPTIFRINNATDGHYFLVRGRANDIASPGLAEIYYDGGSSVISYYSTSRIDDGNWHHIVFVANGNTDSKLYVDGILENSSSTNVGTLSLDGSSWTKKIGGEGTGEDFVGTIDEVAVYSEALTSTQIARNYATGIPKTTLDKLLSYSPEWSFNFERTISGTTYLTNQGSEIPVDLAGYPFSNTNTVTRTAGSYPGGPDYSCAFSASGKIAYAGTLQVWNSEVTDGNYTFGMWFKLAGTVGTANTMIMNGGPWISSGTAKVLGSTNGSSSGKLSVYALNGTTYTLAGKRVDDGNWHFLAFRQTGTTGSNNAQIYLDGVLEQQFTTTSTPTGSYLDFGDTSQSSTSTTMTLGNFFIGTSSAYSVTELLAIYQTAYVPNIPVSITETPATASGNIPEPSITAQDTVSIGDTPATASALMVDPSLSITKDLSYEPPFMSSYAENIPAVTVSAIKNVDFTSGTLTASAEEAAIGIRIDDSHNAVVLTANAVFALVEPTITTQKSIIYTATPLTASAASGDHLRGVVIKTSVGNYDAYTNSDQPTTNFGSSRITLYKQGSTYSRIWMKYDLPTGVLQQDIQSGTLDLTIYANTDVGTHSVHIYRANASWDESTLTHNNKPSGTLIGTYLVTLPSSGVATFPMTDVVNAFDSNSNYGFYLEFNNNTGSCEFENSEQSTSSVRPLFTFSVDVGGPDKTVSATAITASGLMVDPNLNLGIGKTITETPATGSALMVNPAYSAGTQGGYTADHLEADARTVDPTVSAQKNSNFTQSNGLTATGIFVQPQITAQGATLNVIATPITATALMGNALPAIGKSTPAPALTASATMVNPTVASDFNRIIYAGAFSVAATLLDPLQAILETDDPYYQAILETSSLYDTEWFRLDEVSGSVVNSKTKQISAANLQANGTYVNTPVFGNVGPRNRKVLGFTGSQYVTLPHTYGASTTGDWLGAAASSVSEMTIKTVATTGTLLDGEDANTLAGAGNPIGWTLDLYNGKLRYRKWVVATNVPGTNRLVEYQVIGNKLINDNSWHHIVVQIGNQYNGKDIEIFIDGDLDIARYDASDTPIMAHPDRLFGNSVTTMNYAYTGPNPTNQVGNPEPMPNFTGQVMEYVFRPNITLTEYQIENLYYSALDIATEQFDAVTATATFPEPYVAGNKPKALMLSFWPYADYRDTITFNPVFDEYASGGSRYVNGGFDPEVYDVWEYYVNRVSVSPQLTSIGDTPEVGGYHRDAVTDEPILLDPFTIPNLSKFDIIKINGYPIDSNDINAILPANISGGTGDYQENLKALETFVTKVRSIVDTYGTSLLVTNPRLAADLGIIDDTESIDQLYEVRYAAEQSSQNQGLYDYRSSKVDPVANPTGVGTGTSISPYGYFDLHRNNKLRIVATQTGLTDLTGGWTLEDAVTYIPRDPLAIERYSYKYKDTRTTGLQIGDETLIAGLQTSKNQLSQASGDVYGIFPANETFEAFPPTSVKAGTVIAKLGATYWNGTEEKANPYANYVAAIAINPGDSLKGTAVGGKIYVDITNKQDTRYATAAIFQTTNGSASTPVIPGISTADTAYEKQWQYSTGRLSLTGDNANVVVDQAITTPDEFNNASGSGSLRQVTNPSTGETYFVKSYTSQLFSIVVEEKYPTVQVWAPSLLERGMMWLRSKIVVNPNDKTIRPEAMIAEALHKNSTVYINKSIVTNAASMISNGYLVEPDNVISVDARIVTLPLTATATITGSGRRFQATPMTASAILNTDSVTFAGGEQVVVTLHEAISIDLYIKEEAY